MSITLRNEGAVFDSLYGVLVDEEVVRNGEPPRGGCPRVS